MLELSVVPVQARSLLERWSAVVREFGDRPALVDGAATYSYREVDQASEAAAARILEMVGPDDGAPVALLVEHDAPGLIALLTVMKTDRVAVFLDPHLPVDRLRTIVGLAGSRTCIVADSAQETAGQLGGVLGTVVPLDTLIKKDPISLARGAGARSVPAAHRAGSDAVALVFTSGSTGLPKGVIQTHDQFLNDADQLGERFALTPEDRIALVLPYGFSAGMSLIFAGLLSGASLWSIDPRDVGTRKLLAWVRDHQLTTLHCTPHLLRSITATLPSGSPLESLRLVSTVGEAIHASDVAAMRERVTARATYVNWSGSSEIGALALFEIGPDDELPPGTVPAGKLLKNKDVYLELDDGRMATEGEPGQIITVSDYLSGGYWGDDAANASRFGTWVDGRRFCRQGDVGRFDQEGNLQLLGRSDAAIKVRGYLVEPSEIEAAFLAEPGVLEAVVVPVVQNSSSPRLVAYVVPDPTTRTQSPAALRRSLRDRLPSYMVPATVVNIAELPRNERGKVDRARLPEVQLGSSSEPPSDQWEIVVANLWTEVLGLDFIGRDDDFMALGGDSLLVEEMLAAAQDRFGVALISSDLIETPTLREFTRRVTQGSAALPSHPDVAVLNESGTAEPIFCFAGSGALALSFAPLSRHFPDRPFYAFQAHGLERRALPDRTVEAAAHRFLEIMRIIRPHGPYILIGHSFGGLLAYHIAQMLLEAGEDVELLGMLDTYLPRSTGRQPTFTYESLKKRSATTRADRARDFIVERAERAFPGSAPKVYGWTRRFRSYFAGVVPYSGQRQFDAFFDIGNNIVGRYKIKSCAVKAVVVLADGNPDGRAAWESILAGPHVFVDIESEHSSLLREPHATRLAQTFDAVLSNGLS